LDISAYDQPLSKSYSGMAIPIGGTTSKDSPRAEKLKYATEIKKVVDIPVIGVGKLDDPVLANQILKNEETDFIAIGRGLLADPYLPDKAKKGILDEINHCIYCNICHKTIQNSRPIKCPINQKLGSG
jgi:2,4-dienoyl-CoA reductase-like NADH-dependent reductase (Old Yellow Enzyme family)